MADETKVPTWGYSKDRAQIFDLADGESLPAGYYANPASVPGSEAEAAYKADAEREGAPTPLVTEAPAPPEKPAKDTSKDAPKDTGKLDAVKAGPDASK